MSHSGTSVTDDEMVTALELLEKHEEKMRKEMKSLLPLLENGLHAQATRRRFLEIKESHEMEDKQKAKHKARAKELSSSARMLKSLGRLSKLHEKLGRRRARSNENKELEKHEQTRTKPEEDAKKATALAKSIEQEGEQWNSTADALRQKLTHLEHKDESKQPESERKLWSRLWHMQTDLQGKRIVCPKDAFQICAEITRELSKAENDRYRADAVRCLHRERDRAVNDRNGTGKKSYRDVFGVRRVDGVETLEIDAIFKSIGLKPLDQDQASESASKQR